jgi:methylenetetrahydrofolate--tRNA-(uracil-5-)-methyltransferase
MRPGRWTPAHRTAMLAELVCSNSFGSQHLPAASALLMREMEVLDSLLVRTAKRCAVPAGRALAVDRTLFAAETTRALAGVDGVRVVRREATRVPGDGVVVVATGPLTSPDLSGALAEAFGRDNLHFYDALSPIVSAESLDMRVLFRGSRYEAGDGGYLNAPLSEREYHRFVEELEGAKTAAPHEFERRELFHACMPIEELARTGGETLAHGPLRPVGLTDLSVGSTPYAVVQLRAENAEETCFGLVGFQTRLTRSEQRRVFRLLPGLEDAEFLRYGAVHRNTFLDGPRILREGLRSGDGLLVAGQLTGAEGYLEAAATGILAGLNALRLLRGKDPVEPPATTLLGSLSAYVRSGRPRSDRFQPMNAHFGLLPPLSDPCRSRRERREALSRRALAAMGAWGDEIRS